MEFLQEDQQPQNTSEKCQGDVEPPKSKVKRRLTLKKMWLMWLCACLCGVTAFTSGLWNLFLIALQTFIWAENHLHMHQGTVVWQPSYPPLSWVSSIPWRKPERGTRIRSELCCWVMKPPFFCAVALMCYFIDGQPSRIITAAKVLQPRTPGSLYKKKKNTHTFSKAN